MTGFMLPIGYKSIRNRSVTQIYFSDYYNALSQTARLLPQTAPLIELIPC